MKELNNEISKTPGTANWYDFAGYRINDGKISAGIESSRFYRGAPFWDFSNIKYILYRYCFSKKQKLEYARN